VEHAVDGEPLVGEAQAAQLFSGARGFLHGARVGPGDEHHGGERGVAQGLQRGVEAGLLHLQARVRAQARGAAIVVGEKAAPGLGQAQEAQGVAGGRGVEHHVVVARAITLAHQQRGEFIERGDLGGAGARELFAHGVALGVGGVAAQLREHAQAVGLGGSVGVDVDDREARHTGHVHRLVRQGDAQHVVQVGRGVGADQQHAVARVGQGNGRGGGQRGFAHAAFAGEKQEARGRGGEARRVEGGHVPSMAPTALARADPHQGGATRVGLQPDATSMRGTA